MIAKLIPILLALSGIGAGLGGGLVLRPDVAASVEAEPIEAEEPKEDNKEGVGESDFEYVKLNNQFVIPLVEQGTVASLVVLSLSVEVEPGYKDVIFTREPKLRDSFLQVLFDHANIGGFEGSFTNAENLAVLRASLRSVAKRDIGDQISDVLILEIARQDY